MTLDASRCQPDAAAATAPPRWAAVALIAGLAAALVWSPLTTAQAAAPTLEYIAHASFVVESPTGVRVVIDPFNSDRWLGLAYPVSVAADAVLVSHPHYDHDASYYFPSGTPVFRNPGRFSIGDVRVEGHQGRHADPYGRDFEQVNTIWVVETGGVRLAHFGDNGPPSAATLAALGRIDVLLVPDDAQEHILSRAAVAAVRAALSPRLTIPMHYRHGGYRDLPSSLGPVALVGAEPATSHRLLLDGQALARSGRAVVLRPSPEVVPWNQALADAWSIRDRVSPPAGSPATADPEAQRRRVDGLKTAAALVPSVLVFQYELAEALAGAGEPAAALSILERTLAAADRQDAEYTMRARLLIAELYVRSGREALAVEQYRLVASQSRRPAQVALARAFLQARGRG